MTLQVQVIQEHLNLCDRNMITCQNMMEILLTQKNLSESLQHHMTLRILEYLSQNLRILNWLLSKIPMSYEFLMRTTFQKEKEVHQYYQMVLEIYENFMRNYYGN